MRSKLFAAALIGFSGSAAAADFNVAQPTAQSPMTVIMLSGTLEPGDAARFSQLMANATTAMVFLNSDGGNLIEGLQIGEFIHAHGFGTAVVETRCASSCALIWVAGTTRIVSPRAQIGFHSAFRAGDKSESGQANAFVGAYLTRLGYNYDAIAYMTQAHPDSMQWLSYADAARLQMILTEATPELVALVNSTTMGREGLPPIGTSVPQVAAPAPQALAALPPPAQSQPATVFAPGSFPLVPGGIQGTLETVVGRETDRAYATGHIGEPDIENYCRRDPDPAGCIQRYLSAVDAPISAAANCSNQAEVYYFRHEERAGIDFRSGKVIVKGGFNEPESRSMLAVQFKWLCPNAARSAGLGG